MNFSLSQLAIHLLDLSVLSIENDVATPFQLCGIVVPKLVSASLASLVPKHLV